MTEDTGKVHKLQTRKRPTKDDKPALRAVENFKCKHNHIVVDEKLFEVECDDCGEKLNPIWVLAKFAKQDESLTWRRDALKKEIEAYEDRLRFKCGSCGQVNNITKPLRTRTINP